MVSRQRCLPKKDPNIKLPVITAMIKVIYTGAHWKKILNAERIWKYGWSKKEINWSYTEVGKEASSRAAWEWDNTEDITQDKQGTMALDSADRVCPKLRKREPTQDNILFFFF